MQETETPAEARDRFVQTYGDPIIHTSGTLRISFYSLGYRGTPTQINELLSPRDFPAFSTKYPNHRVFADGGEIIGSIRNGLDVNSDEYRESVRELNQAVEARGITNFNLAIITTGSTDLTPGT